MTQPQLAANETGEKRRAWKSILGRRSLARTSDSLPLFEASECFTLITVVAVALRSLSTRRAAGLRSSECEVTGVPRRVQRLTHRTRPPATVALFLPRPLPLASFCCVYLKLRMIVATRSPSGMEMG